MAPLGEDLAVAARTGINAAVAGRPAPTVVNVAWVDPPMIAGPTTFLSELVRVAGGRPGAVLLAGGPVGRGDARRLRGWRRSLDVPDPDDGGCGRGRWVRGSASRWS